MKKKRVKPDDYFSAEPLEFARFGKNVVMRSNATTEQLEALHKVLLENLPDVENRIDLLVTTAVDLINRYNPAVLLHRAYWAMASHHTVFVTDDTHTQVDTESDDALTSIRTLEYIQNIIVSAPPSETQKNEVAEEDWELLVETVRELYKTFNNEYLMAEAIRSRKEEGLADEVAKFRTQSIAHWVNVRGERYSNYEQEHLEDLLFCHNELIEDVFGIPATALVKEIYKIQNSLIVSGGNATLLQVSHRGLPWL